MPIEDEPEQLESAEAKTIPLKQCDWQPAKDAITLQIDPGSFIPSAMVPESIRYFGDYELISEIARGGMGVVYKAKQANLNRLVALKMILAGQLASDEDVRRFYAEAEAAAALEHPGIVPIFEIGKHNDQHFFSMGLVDGESLADKVKDGPLPFREAATYTKKIAEAIAFAHSRGVIHRDLKPANVLLDRNSEPKVTDFGLARHVEGNSDLTRTGAVIGTPSYMSPEQASGKTNDVGPLADVYSLGAILYCLLTGRPPFQASNPLDTLLQVIDREPVLVTSLNPAVQKDLETICLKCLHKDPTKRYASAQGLAEDLGRWLNGEPICARPVSNTERAWRWMNRNPIISSLIAITAVAVLAGTSSSIWFGISANYAASSARDAEQQAKLQRNIASLRSYRTGLAFAQMSINKRELREAERALSECEPSHRGWEFSFLEDQLDQFLGARFTPSDGFPPLAIDIHPTKPLIAFGTKAGNIEVWDLQSREVASKWAVPTQEYDDENALVRALNQEKVGGLKFSPDGEFIAAYGSVSASTFVWELSEHRLVYEHRGSNRTFISITPSGCCPVFSKDGGVMVSCSEDGIVAHRTSDWQELWRNPEKATALAFTRDGSRLIVGKSFGGITILDAKDGTEIKTIGGRKFIVYAENEADAERQRMYGHQGPINSIVSLDDCVSIATGSADGTVRFWNIDKGERLNLINHRGNGVAGLSTTWREGDLLAISSDGVLQLVQSDNQAPLETFYYNSFNAIDFEPRQSLLAIATENAVHVLDQTPFESTNGAAPLLADGIPSLIKLSPDARFAVMVTKSDSDKSNPKATAMLIDIRAQKVVAQNSAEWTYDMGFGANSSFFSLCNTKVTVYSTEDGRVIAESGVLREPITSTDEYTDSQGKLHSGRSTSFSHNSEVGLWLPTKKMIVSGGYPITIWNDRGELIRQIEVKSDAKVESTTIYFDRSVQPTTTFDFIKYSIAKLWQSPFDDSIVFGTVDSEIRGWNVNTGTEAFRWKSTEFGNIVDVLADGTILREGDAKSWTLWSWGLERRIGVLTHDGAINCVALHPSGNRIATGGDDGKVIVWQLLSAEPLLTLDHGRTPVVSLAFSSDGRDLVAADKLGNVRKWSIGTRRSKAPNLR